MDNTAGAGDAGSVSRRQFLRTSLSAAAVGALAAPFASRAFAQGGEEIRVGLVGCGGRGTGAAMQSLKADPAVRLVAMGDVFAERIEGSLGALQESDLGDHVTVDAEHRFVGLDAGRKVIDSVDVVLLCEYPQFRPAHLAAAVAAGKHAFVEKPIAVDVPGVHSVLASCEQAKAKNLNIVSGLCWRYEEGMREAVQRVQDGQIGEIVALQSTRHENRVARYSAPQPGWSKLEEHIRNWYLWTWISGDFVAEQYVHDIDMMCWAMGEYPVRCTSSGGRQVPPNPNYGDTFDTFATVFEFANGVKLFADTRQWEACDRYYTNSVIGTTGVVDLLGNSNTNRNTVRREGKSDMYQSEHDALYGALRAGQPINNGEYMAKSTLAGLMARQSAYAGRDITWDQIWNSTENLSPPTDTWDAAVVERPVPTPGQYQFS